VFFVVMVDCPALFNVSFFTLSSNIMDNSETYLQTPFVASSTCPAFEEQMFGSRDLHAEKSEWSLPAIFYQIAPVWMSLVFHPLQYPQADHSGRAV
jgi:hypothetical protein